MSKHLVISKELNEKFRKTISKKEELEKGIIQKCTEEAIRDWIIKNNNERG